MMPCDSSWIFFISECAIWMISYSWTVILALKSSSRLLIQPPKARKLCIIASLSSIFGCFSAYDGDDLCLLSRRCLNYPLRQRGLYVSVMLQKDSSGQDAIRTNKLLLQQIFYYLPSLEKPNQHYQRFTLPKLQHLTHICHAACNETSIFINEYQQSLQVQLIQIMSKLYTAIGLFLIGFTDSVSLRWIPDILFYTDRRTKRILQESLDLQKALLRSLVQAGLITTLLPIIVRWMGFVILGWVFTVLSLLFTYSYLIFYNMDVTEKAMKVIIWKTQQHPDTMPELDKRHKYNIFIEMSYLIQSFIFEMVYYTPMNLLLIVITLFDETYFPVVLVIMDSFFNTAFYYFRKWPYDKYNVAFLQKNMAYSLGYGFFVSIVTNVMLPPSMSIGGYLLISQWMIINALYHTPPQVEFHSFLEVYNVLVNREERRKLPSAYNIHRDRLNKDKDYRKQIMKDLVFMKSFFILTEKINKYLQKNVFKRDQQPGQGGHDSSPDLKQSQSSADLSSKFTLDTTQLQNSGSSLVQKQGKNSSNVFVDPQREESTVINLQFKDDEQPHEKNP